MLLALLVSGGWYVAKNYQIAGLDQITLLPRPSSPGEVVGIDGALPVVAASHRSASGDAAPPLAVGADPVADRTLRVGLFNLDQLSFDSISDPATRQRIARLIRRMDLIALQGIGPRGTFDIDALVAETNREGGTYNSVAGPLSGNQRLAFVFDTQRVLIDAAQTYSVADPSDLLQTDPLVGWFRAANPPPTQAWTFTLVNMSIQRPAEAALIRSVYDAVQADDREEDDCLIAVSFSATTHGDFGRIAESGLNGAVPDGPTTILADAHLDNIVFGPETAAEFTGKGGAIDFLRAENLSLQEARAMSTHSPVWGRFLATEQPAF